MRGQSVEHHRSTRVLAVASGRGGVDKTNVLASSAFALAKLRKNTIVVILTRFLKQDWLPLGF